MNGSGTAVRPPIAAGTAVQAESVPMMVLKPALKRVPPMAPDQQIVCQQVRFIYLLQYIIFTTYSATQLVFLAE